MYNRVFFCVAVLGPSQGEGTQAPSFAPGPPVSHPPTIFGKDNTKSDLFELPNFRKVDKFAASIKCPKTKSASASGGFAPWPLTRGSAPGPRWELCSQTPIRGSRYRARHGAEPPDVAG